MLLQSRRVGILCLWCALFLWLISPGRHNLHTSRTSKTERAMKSNSITVTENSTDPPTLYHCCGVNGGGMRELRAVFSSVFPDSLIVDLSDHVSRKGSYYKLNKINTHKRDIFLGFYYPVGCGEPVSQWLFLRFQGSVVIHSPESQHTHPNSNRMLTNIHYFGPVKESIKREGDLLLTYLQTVWWADFQKELSVSTLIYGKNRTEEPLNPFFMIYAHGNCVKFREIAAWQFSKHGIVHLGGKCQGLSLDGNRSNLQHVDTGITLRNWRDNKHLYSRYRFCLVMEHEEDHSAYITEKILLAFVGGCVPIYHGPSLIFDIFNKDSFVYYNISDPIVAQTKVQELEADPYLYKSMANAPILAKGDETLKKYFSFSESVGDGFLKNRIRRLLSVK